MHRNTHCHPGRYQGGTVGHATFWGVRSVREGTVSLVQWLSNSLTHAHTHRHSGRWGLRGRSQAALYGGWPLWYPPGGGSLGPSLGGWGKNKAQVSPFRDKHVSGGTGRGQVSHPFPGVLSTQIRSICRPCCLLRLAFAQHTQTYLLTSWETKVIPMLLHNMSQNSTLRFFRNDYWGLQHIFLNILNKGGWKKKKKAGNTLTLTSVKILLNENSD